MIKEYFKSEHLKNACIAFLMLALLLSSIVLASFHNHQCDKTAHNCAICLFQITYAATPIEAAVTSAIFQKPLPERVVNFNDKATDPSQKLVCSSHAPPLDTPILIIV